MKTSAEYRAEAVEKMQGNYLMAFVLSIIYTALTTLLTSLVGMGEFILGGVLTIGFAFCYLNVIHGKQIDLANLFTVLTNGGLTSAIVMHILRSIFIFLWSLLFVIPGIIASYRYAMADYILADNPTLDGKSALELSKQVMNGKKWNLFCLNLSYIGWILLSAFTLGILMIWVSPRMAAAKAAFYESIKDEIPVPSSSDSEEII